MENPHTVVTTPIPSAIASEPVIVSIPIITMVEGNMFSANGNPISLNAFSQILYKLAKNGGNYSSWKSQMINLLFGYGLLRFVDGSYT
ncbi:Hypothetical predicted protein [Olea europaea subsp. europaea]|uniref:Uncharacterized protein n=1 Tax=Olea europaea subsp. europaea TaxID=158383 RepID=A0A8S0UCN6_OLEEU|nr:Hypothetical predicted protein [Olea europaea subsp. europaea]